MWLINMTVIDDKLRNKETVLKRNLDVGHALFTELNQNTTVEGWQDYSLHHRSLLLYNAENFSSTQTITTYQRQQLATADYHFLPQTTTPQRKQPLPTADNHSLPQTTTSYRRQPPPTADNHSLQQITTPTIDYHSLP